MKLRKVKQKQLVERVLITDAAAEGNAIAKIDEMVVFVPFVVPGDIYSKTSDGTNFMISEGAILVTNYIEILGALEK